MEILTLLKANIRHKKGAFLSIAILTVVIVASMTAVLSLRRNFHTAMEHAFDAADGGDSNPLIESRKLTDELLASVRDSRLVERVTVYDAIGTLGPTLCGEVTDYNSYFLMKVYDTLSLYNSSADGFEDHIPSLQSGEVYLPYGLKDKLKCGIGDTVTFDLASGKHDLVIKGFLQEPVQGAPTLGWKLVFISDEDYNEYCKSCESYESTNVTSFFQLLEIHKADASLSDAKFQRELNLETGIIDQSMGGLTKAQCVRYTGLYLDIMTDILMVFVLLLFVIVLIVIGHNISTEIEIDYVNLGILKAQGFTDKKIAALLMLQYVLAELIGIVLGFVLSYPLERSISDIFMDITAILPSHAVAAAQSALFLALILSASLLLSWSSTRRLAKISPVRAISGGREEIYFDSRFHAPVSKRALSLSLAFRSFTSAKRRYVGILFISALLTFFALTVNIVGDIVKSRSALEMMGMEYIDLNIHFMDREAREHVQDFEEIIESYSEITKKYYRCSAYLSLNGENLQCLVYQYPEYISGMLKGRQPLYDNEIVITEMVADTLELSMGDEVVVTFENRQATYLISGIYQSTHDAGMCFAMSQEGARRLSTVSISFMGVALADASQSKRIAQELTEKYGDIIEAESYDSSTTSYVDEMFDDSILAMQAVIYSFSTIFALITVIMVCNKAFIQERRDIGIYKAIGFTSGKLRRQFSLRYFIVSLIGGAVGVVLSMLLSVKALNMIFSLFGITHVAARFSTGAIAVAILFVSGCVLIFSFAASRKVKKVDVRELITE